MAAPHWTAAIPAGLVALLLLTATWFDGAFQVRHWAPLAIFTLVGLATIYVARGTASLGRWERVAIAAFWGLVAWSAASALWAESVTLAWDTAGRYALYAALVTVPLVLVRDPRHAVVIGWGLVAGIAALSVGTLVAVLADGEGMFLAGRLDGPVNYRNATALLFGLGFWPLICFAGARGGARTLRAAALSAAALELGLAFLTQSRGVLLGLLLGGVVAVAVGPDRLRRVWLAVIAVLLVAAASPWLLDPYDAFDAGRGIVADADIATAGQALLLLSAGAFVLGFALAVLDNGLRAGSRALRTVRRLALAALAAAAVATAAVGLAATGNPVDFIDEKIDEFTSLETDSESATRFGTTSGQRYDLWRIALLEFGENPVTGVGAGNYRFRYFEERRTDRNLTSAHSFPLTLMAETGLVALLLLLLAIVAVGVSLRAAWAQASRDRRMLAAGLASTGAVVLGQTSVDWISRVPGIMGLGLFALALAVTTLRPRRAEADAPAAARIGAAVALGVAALTLAAFYLSDYYIRAARAETTSATAQLDDARSARDFNPWSVTARYLEAGALEALGRNDDARDALERARELEPDNFATIAVLGDLEVRAGRLAQANRLYREALERNPRDVGLEALVRGTRTPPRED